MAAFTALAVGLGAGYVAGKLIKKKNKEAPLSETAPGPSESLAAPAPPDAGKAGSDAAFAALSAAKKQRRKGAGPLTGRSSLPQKTGSLATPAAKHTPRTLSGY